MKKNLKKKVKRKMDIILHLNKKKTRMINKKNMIKIWNYACLKKKGKKNEKKTTKHQSHATPVFHSLA